MLKVIWEDIKELFRFLRFVFLWGANARRIVKARPKDTREELERRLYLVIQVWGGEGEPNPLHVRKLIRLIKRKE